MRKIWHDEAWDDYISWQSQDKKTLRKINKLLSDIDRNGYNCTGKPEPLKYNRSGFWSVRIQDFFCRVFQVLVQDERRRLFFYHGNGIGVVYAAEVLILDWYFFESAFLCTHKCGSFQL